MPYKDPEKRREAQRRYVAKKGPRRHNWMLVFYEDACPHWRDELDEIGLAVVVSPLHDKDAWTAADEAKNPDHKAGEFKVAHRHLIACYDNPVTYEEVKEDFAFLGSQNIKYVKSLRAMARYLCHMDSKDKAKYSPDAICEFGGADWHDMCQTGADKHQLLRDMRAFIVDNEVRDFAAFWVWCDENNEEWSRALDNNCGWAVKEFIHSNRAVVDEKRRAVHAAEEHNALMGDFSRFDEWVRRSAATIEGANQAAAGEIPPDDAYGF